MDFAQHGEVTTFHRLTDRKLVDLEADLEAWTRDRPLTVVLPCLAAEMDGPALSRLVDELARATFVRRVVIGLDRAERSDLERAREFFGRLPQPHDLLWQDGPALRAVEADLVAAGVAAAPAGKGRNVWWCLGHALGRADDRPPAAIALQDADVVDWSRELLARLVYPVVHPTFGFVMAKGYYVRSDGTRLHGRVTRLLVAPLLRALDATAGPTAFVDFLASFRYPLAGEVCLRSDTALAMRVEADWGLELGTLSEVHRLHRPSQVCQVDLADAYDHKHQPVSADDPSDGLHRMAIDLTCALLGHLASDGTVLSADALRALQVAFRREALVLVDRYHADAVMSGLRHDRQAEVELVDVFQRAVATAAGRTLGACDDRMFLPSWQRVRDEVPDVHERIAEAVDADR